MKTFSGTLSFLVVLVMIPVNLWAQTQSKVNVWLTNKDRSALFQEQTPSLHLSVPTKTQNPVIEIDEKKTFQSIDGFGFALTGGSAQHLHNMAAQKRAALLKELFATDGKNIGISYLRVSIGASDLNDHVYSYDDLPSGQTDPEMAKFSLKEDQEYVIPVLKEILKINPSIRILGSPWSAPAWMKINNDVKGGKLKPELYGAYAKYFVKYIQEMTKEGTRIDAITIQNEPLNEKNTPSMQMLASEEAEFIKNYLGPAFKAANIKTKIILYDHNCDVPEYATSILNDPEANKYVDGSGFHLYGGNIDAMTTVHNAYPTKNLYFTEYMAVQPPNENTIAIAKPVEGTLLGALQNWSKNVLLWNLAANSKFEPHTGNGGCPICQGAVTIDGNEVTRNLAYYVMAHASKFVRPGSVRIGSNAVPNLSNVAFHTPQGKTVLIVVNSGDSPQTFNVSFRKKAFSSTLLAGSVATFVW